MTTSTDRAGLRARLEIAPEVADAIAGGRAVVALESTLISHGLPWPENLAVALASEDAVRESGAVPATIAIRDGGILVGLDTAGLELLASAPAGSVRKVSRHNLGAALAAGGWAATTVATTMLAADAAGIRVLATGGIGGVHRGALGGGDGPATFDISADLDELAATPMAVVCAGPKAILDVLATVQYLETRGVPVMAVGQDELPGFYARSSGIPAPIRAADLATAAGIVAAHLSLGLGSAALICVPVPAADALTDEEVRSAVQAAITEAGHARLSGAELTPWLLARVAILTDGRSVRANRALIVNDARIAGRLATLLAAASRKLQG